MLTPGAFQLILDIEGVPPDEEAGNTERKPARAVGVTSVTFSVTAVVPDAGMPSIPATVTLIVLFACIAESVLFADGIFSDAQKGGTGVLLQRVSANRIGDTGK